MKTNTLIPNPIGNEISNVLNIEYFKIFFNQKNIKINVFKVNLYCFWTVSVKRYIRIQELFKKKCIEKHLALLLKFATHYSEPYCTL